MVNRKEIAIKKFLNKIQHKLSPFGGITKKTLLETEVFIPMGVMVDTEDILKLAESVDMVKELTVESKSKRVKLLK